MLNVNRDSPNEKILGLISEAPKLFDEMEHMCFLSGGLIRFTNHRLQGMRYFSTLLAFFINLIILLTYTRNVSESYTNIEITKIIDLDWMTVEAKDVIYMLGVA